MNKTVTSKRRQHGLTLIELMVVLAIIGILATIGATQYQDYIARSRVVEGLNLAAPYKLAVAEHIATGGGSFTREQLGVPERFTPTQDVQDINVTPMAQGAGGVITITYGPRLDNKTLTLTPLVSASGVQWFCAGKEVSLPAGGAATNAGFQAGTLEPRFAPANCRG